MRKWLFVSIVVEALSKLTLYGSVLLLFVGLPGDRTLATTHAAGLLALVAAAMGFSRTWLRAKLFAKQLDALCDALVRAARRKSVSGLLARDDAPQPADLVHCAVEVATVQALSVPDLVASFIGVGLLLALTAARLGPLLLGLGLAAALLLVLVLAPLRRRSREAREGGWNALVSSTKDFSILVKGAFELRGAGLERAIERRFLKDVGDVAVAEQRSMLLGGISGLLPAFLGIALLTLPRAWLDPWLGARLGEVGVLAAAGVGITLAATSALDAVTRNAPLRRDLGRFLDEELGWLIDVQPGASPGVGEPGRPITSIAFDQVSIRYEGALATTPTTLTFSLASGGIALIGENGVGKTTALMAALGLIEPSSGSVSINGAAATPAAWDALRKRCFIVPQRPYVVPDETIRFHMSGFGSQTLSDSDLERALEPMALLERLRSRATRAKVLVGDLPFSTLSGGEQRRILLSVSTLRAVDFFLFDEPEAGLDAAGRHAVRDLFERLSKDRLVLLSAHDPSVIPDGFARVVIHRGE